MDMPDTEVPLWRLQFLTSDTEGIIMVLRVHRSDAGTLASG